MYLIMATLLALFANNPTTHTTETIQLDEVTITDLMEVEAIPEGEVTVQVKIKTPEVVEEMTQRLPLFTRENGGIGHPVTLSINGSTPQQINSKIDGFQYSAPVFASFAPAMMQQGSFDGVSFEQGNHSGILNYQLSQKKIFGGFAGSFGSHGFFFNLPSKQFTIGGSFLQSENDFSYIDSNGKSRTRLNNHYQGLNLYMKGEVLEGLTWLNLISLSGRGAPGSAQFEHTESTIRELEYLGGVKYNHLFDDGEITLRGSYGLKQYRYNDHLTQMLGNPEVAYNLLFHNINMKTLGSYFIDRYTLKGAFDIKGYRVDIESNGEDQVDHDSLEVTAKVGGEGGFFDERLILRVSFGSSMNSGADLNFNYLAAIWYQPNKLFKSGLVHRRGIRYPYPEERYLNSDTIKGNPELNPEISISTHLHNTINRKGFTLDLELFYKKMENNIVFVPISFDLITGANIPDVTLYGGTLFLSYEHEYCAISHRSSYLTSDLKNDRQLPHIPRWQHHTTITLRTGKERGWFITGKQRYSGKTYYDLYNVRVLKKKQLFHLIPGYREKSWNIQLKIENLTNQRDLFDTFHQPLPSRGFYLQFTLFGA